MYRRFLVCASLAALAGCSFGDSLKPPRTPAVTAPAFRISDGAHPGTGSNPDFFFLPPMVPDPSGNANFDRGASNARLLPTVDICEVNATTEQQVNAGAPCKGGGYFLSMTLGPSQIKPDDASTDPGGSHYSFHWQVPRPSVPFFRVTVRVESKTLGSADVEMVADGTQIKNVSTGEFVPLVAGNTLPINFRIEQLALCSPPGVAPCASASVNLAAGGTVSAVLSGSSGPTGVDIPVQTQASPPVVITVQSCPNLNDRVLDLPTYGSCMRITSDPPLPPSGLTSAAVVFICDLSGAISGNVTSEAQERRITMHRLDVDADGPHVTALPHTSGCPVALSSAEPTVRGALRSLAHGQWKAAGGQALRLLGPKPLYAARYLDQGGGGLSEDFSDFQFALPAKMSDIRMTQLDPSNPAAARNYSASVVVTDLGGQPVKGARISFSTLDGVLSPGRVVTGADGVAQVMWTRGPQGPTAETGSISASGRGVAGADNNGPRPGIDPFQPIQSFFDGVTTGGIVGVYTGTQSGGVSPAPPAAPAPPTASNAPVSVFSYTFVPGLQSATSGLGCLNDGPSWLGGFMFAASARVPVPVTQQSFVAPYAGAVSIAMQLDNDVQVWLDGINVTRFGLAPDGAGHLDGAWWSRDCLASQEAPVFTVPNVAAGSHVVTIYVNGLAGTTILRATGILAP